MEEVHLDDAYSGIFRLTAGHRHSRTPVHKARWRFGLFRNPQPGQHEAEIDGYLGNAG
jgi:hypothetical protein